jgi:peptide/nickel transport system permease protein
MSGILRAIRGLAVLFVVVALTYAIFYLGPADPALAMCGKPCSPENLEAAREFMGFSDPWWQQMLTFMGGIFTGRSFGSAGVVIECAAPCLGYSFQMHQSVTSLIIERFPVSVSVALGAIVLQTIVGVGLGALAARKQGTVLDRAITGSAVFAASAPSYVVGLILLLIFAFKLNLLPSGDYLLLPWITLAVLNGAVYARLVRSSMIEQLGLDYARTARAAGLGERRIDGYALRNLALPVMTLTALDVGALLGGTVITERVFGLPGMGLLLIGATGTVDLPIIVGTTLFSAALIVIANLVADLLGPLLDRRLAAPRGALRTPRQKVTNP